MSVVDVANAISIVLILNVILLFLLRSLALNIIPVLPESDAESVFKIVTTHSLEFNKPEQNEPVLASTRFCVLGQDPKFLKIYNFLQKAYLMVKTPYLKSL